MQSYHGTEQQIRLQKKSDSCLDWIRDTKGACNTARFLGTDDPDLLGWDVVLKHLKTDGIFGFRMIPTDRTVEIAEHMRKAGYTMAYWDVFTCSATQIMEQTNELPTDLPDGVEPVPGARLTEAATLSAIQHCMIRSGIAPFSGFMLSGQAGPSVLVALQTLHGEVVATAYGYLPHNRFSPHSSTAWGGLVAVDKAYRGRRLGVLVNCLMVRKCVDVLGAHTVYELVAQDNLASRRMVERCGLEFNAFYKSGTASRSQERFTR